MAGFFVRRPIVAMVIAIIIVIVGLVALGRRGLEPRPTATDQRVDGHHLLAAAILGSKYPEIREALDNFRRQQTETVLARPDPRSQV